MTFYKILFILLMGGMSIGMTTSKSSESNVAHIKITNIRNNKGHIELQVYRDQPTFSKETPWKIFHISKDNLKDKVLNYQINSLPEGTYGFAILDDENNDSKMNWSFLLPGEGFGFSNYYHTTLSKPKFESFKFYLKGDVNVTIKVKYF